VKKPRRTRRQRTELKVGDEVEVFRQTPGSDTFAGGVWHPGHVSRVSGHGTIIDVRMGDGTLLRELHSKQVRRPVSV
jgi:hypothetical protein